MGKHRRISAAPSSPSATTAHVGGRSTSARLVPHRRPEIGRPPHTPGGRSRRPRRQVPLRTSGLQGAAAKPLWSRRPLLRGGWELIAKPSSARPVLCTLRTYGKTPRSAATPLSPTCCVDMGSMWGWVIFVGCVEGTEMDFSDTATVCRRTHRPTGCQVRGGEAVISRPVDAPSGSGAKSGKVVEATGHDPVSLTRTHVRFNPSGPEDTKSSHLPPCFRAVPQKTWREKCVMNTEGGRYVGVFFIGGAVREMEACWPSSVGPAGAGAKPPCGALAEDRRAERQGKGVARLRQVGTGKAFQKRSAGVTRRGVVVEASKAKKDDIEIEGPFSSLEMSLAGARVPGQVVSGVEAARVRSAALARNMRRRASIWRPGSQAPRSREGACQRQKPEALSTDAALAGGPARSSHEAPARWGGGGAKGPAHQECRFDQPGQCPGRKRGNMPKPNDKSFAIPKQLVWEAWRQVRANKGAPGVDGQALEEFESDLENQLYRIWNRMSSGTWFPPPVRAVVIPKPHGGGVRTLGVPTITSYREVFQCVFGFGGGDASVSPACGGASAGVVYASFGGFACVCVRGRGAGERVVARGRYGSWAGVGFGPVDCGGAWRARGAGGRDRWVAGRGEGLLMLCANRAQDGGLRRAERLGAAGAAAAFGAVGGGSAGDVAWHVAESGAPLRSRGVSLRAGRVARPVPVFDGALRWGRPVGVCAGGFGGNGRCVGGGDGAARGRFGGDFTHQLGVVAPAGAGVMGGQRYGRRGVPRAGQYARGGVGGERGR